MTTPTERGNQIKLRRKALGLRRQDLAHKSCVPIESVARVEQGRGIQADSLLRVIHAIDPNATISEWLVAS